MKCKHGKSIYISCDDCIADRDPNLTKALLMLRHINVTLFVSQNKATHAEVQKWITGIGSLLREYPDVEAAPDIDPFRELVSADDPCKHGRTKLFCVDCVRETVAEAETSKNALRSAFDICSHDNPKGYCVDCADARSGLFTPGPKPDRYRIISELAEHPVQSLMNSIAVANEHGWTIVQVLQLNSQTVVIVDTESK